MADRPTSTGEAAWPVRRLLAFAAVTGAAVALASMLLMGGGGYSVHVQFRDAGQLVEGGSVKVAGRKVGTIAAVRLTDDGLADVELELHDDGVRPLRRGTRARIRALGQAGVANRFVDLSPGPDGANEIADGGVIDLDQTTGIVNLDAILSSFGPRQRADVKRLVGRSADVYAGSGARHLNRLIARSDPALAELGELTSELAHDRAAITRVIGTAATTSRALASRSPDLRAAVDNMAVTLASISRERQALDGVLRRAPGVLDQARGTLRGAETAITALRPALREVPPAAGPLDDFLRKTRVTLPNARPVVRQLRGQLPDLRRSLAGLAPLRRPAALALTSAGKALKDARPITHAARIYGSDLLLGVLNGLAGVATANHDRWGHYARLEFTQPPQTTLGGPLSELLAIRPLVPNLFELRTRQLRRCPGGNTPPSRDLSSPWVPDPSLCDPRQNVPADVNEP